MQRLSKALVPEREVEAILEGMSRNTPKSLRKTFSVTEITAACDLRAACHRIPGRIRPLDLSRGRHGITLEQNGNERKLYPFSIVDQRSEAVELHAINERQPGVEPAGSIGFALWPTIGAPSPSGPAPAKDRHPPTLAARCDRPRRRVKQWLGSPAIPARSAARIRLLKPIRNTSAAKLAITLVEREDRGHSSHVAEVTCKSLREAIVTWASRKSYLMTDGAPVYEKIGVRRSRHGQSFCGGVCQR